MTKFAGIVPPWDSVGVLPPIRPSLSGNSPDRSPYKVGLSSFVDRFSTSPERMGILDGLLQFRSKLHGLGITSGFQWLDGSFLENVEILENRSPRDMDVVTFFHIPSGMDQQSLVEHSGGLFDPQYLKSTFSMDAYFTVLGQPTEEWHVRNISYWYSMWSHRRDGRWKGFVQVDLDSSSDPEARATLNINGGLHHE